MKKNTFILIGLMLLVSAFLVYRWQASPKAVYVDVRTVSEWEAGHVAGALHFDIARLEKGEMPNLSKNQQILLYCRTGRRADTALSILKDNGFTQVKNLGGFEDLKTQNLKVCMGSSAQCVN